MILVTGATGLVGAHLLYSLLQEHDTVRATHRSTSDLQAVKKVFSFYTSQVEDIFNRIEWVAANIIEIPNLTKSFEGITQVYHCAAFVNFDPRKYQQLKKTNIEGTANIVNLCLLHKVTKLCYVSSIATLGETLDKSAINEEEDWNPEAKNNVYAITKYGAEMEVWRGVQEGLDVVIINPGIILGEGDFNKGSSVIAKRAAKGIKYYTTGSTGFVDVKDVVRSMIILMSSSIVNERFIMVGANLSYQKVLTLFSESFGITPPRKLLKKSSLKMLSKLDAIAYSLFGRKRKLLKSMVDSLYSTSTYDTTKVVNSARFEFTPIEETVARISLAYSSSSNTGSTNTPAD